MRIFSVAEPMPKEKKEPKEPKEPKEQKEPKEEKEQKEQKEPEALVALGAANAGDDSSEEEVVQRRNLKSVIVKAVRDEHDGDDDDHHVDALAAVIGKQDQSKVGHALKNAKLGGLTLTELADSAKENRKKENLRYTVSKKESKRRAHRCG